MSTQFTVAVPEGFNLHTENSAHILLSSNEAFLNPVQEFNRDLSVACIRVWSEELDKEKETRWIKAKEKKRSKMDGQHARKRQKVMKDSEAAGVGTTTEESGEQGDGENQEKPQEPEKRHPNKVVILEALSATGLRSIRYAKEIPLVKYVIANDLSPAAAAAIRRNVHFNGLGPDPSIPQSSTSNSDNKAHDKIRVNEGDACTLMYNHRNNRVDVVDLDPYGTAAPFIDAAIQSVNDGGLLCITCTDMTVLGTNNYPEKCLSNYGGVPVKGEYCHEAALRLVLHAVSTSASRYGRYIEPLLSLSIDFYVRLFIRVNSSPAQVKKAMLKTSMFYICTCCQAFYEQPLGRMLEKKSDNGNVNSYPKTTPGPPVGDKCPECDSALHVAGPMWSGPIHDTDFVSQVLSHTESHSEHYGTAVRMKGMLTVAKEELHVPFYFTSGKVSSFFHCITPSLDDLASALLHAGHKISRSHASAGSLKTTGSRQDIYDIFRCWVKRNPIKNVSDKSPARRLLAKEPRSEANFKHHPDSVTASSKVKLVRYQETPRNWGPGTRATGTSNQKRKARDDDDG
ncbi:N2,N2-dimethylguanosine tRNA methyltransferase [Dendrothele bispora CBS 962.96]|uniref:tRNA (guanine(26)-N(2))-dimethyltransferase n=1 Tax=Dendrothele bispora (strain CBS 962.96) TaxID=1314807 RepID=A0A4S8KY03_DENBC|nr:N2,N2-dimethylguanosine tRNA methyltransferase [Dendrothele bispora CBS 962.96]